MQWKLFSFEEMVFHFLHLKHWPRVLRQRHLLDLTQCFGGGGDSLVSWHSFWNQLSEPSGEFWIHWDDQKHCCSGTSLLDFPSCRRWSRGRWRSSGWSGWRSWRFCSPCKCLHLLAPSWGADLTEYSSCASPTVFVRGEPRSWSTPSPDSSSDGRPRCEPRWWGRCWQCTRCCTCRCTWSPPSWGVWTSPSWGRLWRGIIIRGIGNDVDTLRVVEGAGGIY